MIASCFIPLFYLAKKEFIINNENIYAISVKKMTSKKVISVAFIE